jgi:GT2 family glycosyltransferase
MQGVQSLKILNTVIYYDNEDEVLEYARKLSEQKGIESIILIIVVNKASSNDFTQFRSKLGKLFISYKIYFPNANLGYLNGAIYGYKTYIEENSDRLDWVLISNTDISFTEKDVFIRFLDSNYEDSTWVVGPSIYSTKTQSYSNPQYVKRYTRRFLERNIFIFSNNMLSYIYQNLALYKSKWFKKRRVPSCLSFSLHGCFFFMRTDLAEYLVKHPYKVILYSEEAYIANIVYQNKKTEFFDSSIEVVHQENSVTGLLKNRSKSKMIKSSLKVILDEFY